MKLALFYFALVSLSVSAWGDSLPAITGQPTNQTISIGGTANFSVSATGANGFQWR